jgi:hypothetical protein
MKPFKTGGWERKWEDDMNKEFRIESNQGDQMCCEKTPKMVHNPEFVKINT